MKYYLALSLYTKRGTKMNLEHTAGTEIPVAVSKDDLRNLLSSLQELYKSLTGTGATKSNLWLPNR